MKKAIVTTRKRVGTTERRRRTMVRCIVAPPMAAARSASHGSPAYRIRAAANTRGDGNSHFDLGFVMAGLVPAIHAVRPSLASKVSSSGAAWMAGTSPAMTNGGSSHSKMRRALRNPRDAFDDGIAPRRRRILDAVGRGEPLACGFRLRLVARMDERQRRGRGDLSAKPSQLRKADRRIDRIGGPAA